MAHHKHTLNPGHLKSATLRTAGLFYLYPKAISIKNNTRKNLTCLDIGCGSGEMELLIHDHFKKIVGIDPTPNQIEIANSHGLVNCDFKMGTGTKLDIKDNAFDVVLIINVMHHIDSGDHLDFLKEVYRVLQPEGKFFVYEHNPLHPLVYLRFYYLSEVDKGAHMINPFKIKQHLKATGFQQIKTRYLLSEAFGEYYSSGTRA